MNIFILIFTYALFAVQSLFLAAGSAGPYYGQFEQDKFINGWFFPNKRNGVFVDIGASDGITSSNSYFFEKYLGWTGICVEPNANSFLALKQARKCICVNGCIYKRTGLAKFIKVVHPKGVDHGWSGLLECYDARQLKKLYDYWVREVGCSVQVVDVQCYLFNDICKENNITHINYLSIDTEGSEFEILKSINFDEINIDVIDVENTFNEDKIRLFLETKGYIFIAKIGVDDIYLKKQVS